MKVAIPVVPKPDGGHMRARAEIDVPGPACRDATRIDVAVPVAPKDYAKLGRCLSGVLQSSETAIGNVYLITTDDKALGHLDVDIARRVTVVRERDMPFTKGDVEQLLEQAGASRRQASWYYQQLLKLYVFEAISGLRDHVLILDADFTFCKRLRFLTADGRALLSRGYPFKWLLHTRDYPAEVDHIHAEFARRLVPGWEPVEPWSGMHHHMLLQRDVVAELFDAVERAHGQPFWRAFAGNVRLEKWNAASEYVLYYHFALARRPERVEVRDLTTCDILHDAADGDADALAEMDRQLGTGVYDAVGCHGFLDLRARLATMDYIPKHLQLELSASRDTKLLLRLQDAVLRIDGGGDHRRSMSSASPAGEE